MALFILMIVLGIKVIFDDLNKNKRTKMKKGGKMVTSKGLPNSI